MEQQLANSLAAKAQPYVEQIEALDREMDSEKGAYMSRIKGMREQRKAVFASAKDQDDIPTRPLKGFVTKRKLERKIADIAGDFDLEEMRAYRELADGALGPLGQAAAVRAGYGQVEPDGDAERDLRPESLRRTERERAEDDPINRVGRG